MRGSGSGNPYHRTHRSDGVAELRQQVEQLQARLNTAQTHPQLEALVEAVNSLRSEIKALARPKETEYEQLCATVKEVRNIMAKPLGTGPDTQVMVECLEQLQLLVRLHRESTEAILQRLNKVDSKRQRLSDPEGSGAGLASAEPKDK
jgi:DNA repair ATPase RecN